VYFRGVGCVVLYGAEGGGRKSEGKKNRASAGGEQKGPTGLFQRSSEGILGRGQSGPGGYLSYARLAVETHPEDIHSGRKMIGYPNLYVNGGVRAGGLRRENGRKKINPHTTSTPKEWTSSLKVKRGLKTAMLDKEKKIQRKKPLTCGDPKTLREQQQGPSVTQGDRGKGGPVFSGGGAMETAAVHLVSIASVVLREREAKV